MQRMMCCGTVLLEQRFQGYRLLNAKYRFGYISGTSYDKQQHRQRGEYRLNKRGVRESLTD
ncbi:hypothetical protein D3C80_1934140 [compost metagenome]